MTATTRWLAHTRSVNDAVEKVVIEHGQMTLHIRRDLLVDVAMTLRNDADLRFEMCLGVTGCTGRATPDASCTRCTHSYP